MGKCLRARKPRTRWLPTIGTFTIGYKEKEGKQKK